MLEDLQDSRDTESNGPNSGCCLKSTCSECHFEVLQLTHRRPLLEAVVMAAVREGGVRSHETPREYF